MSAVNPETWQEHITHAAVAVDAGELSMSEFGVVLVENVPARTVPLPGAWWGITAIVGLACAAIGLFIASRAPTATDFNSCLLVNVKEAKLDIVARAMYQMCEERYRPRATP